MPDLYNLPNAGGSGTLGDNTRKVIPSTRFGTRAIQRWVIYTRIDIEAGWELPNSLYSQLVRALQQNVELYAVYMPGESNFNSEDYDFAFSIDVAADTSVDLWNATGSTFGSEIHPMNWIEGNLDFNNQTKVLIDVVQDALYAAGVDNYCWVNASYTYADQTWPISPPGDDMPGVERNLGSKTDSTLMPAPGDTREILKQKRLKYIAKLRSI